MITMLQTEARRSLRATSPSRWIFAGLFGFGLAVAALLYVLPRPVALKLLDERGPMEIVSLCAYGLGVVWLIPMLGRRPALAAWAMAALLFLSVSEYNPADLMTKWLDKPPPPDTGGPTGVNVWGVAAISSIVAGILAGLLVSSRGSLARGFRDATPESRLALVGGCLLPVCFVIDRIQGYFFNWDRGYRMNKGIFYASDVVEETLEFLMPFFFFFAILLWSRRRKQPGTTS
jgi:hypothetical protein